MPFREPAEVVVRQEGDKDWEVMRSLAYVGKCDEFTVPISMLTDFASVPRVFVWFLPRYGRYTKAAILHDYLWREKARTGDVTWRDADATFRRAMRELDVAFLRRWMMWAAVRWASLFKKGGSKDWWKDSWSVLLATVGALPIVVLPLVTITVSLVIFFLVELLFWVPLKISAAIRTAVSQKPPRKEVNTPSLLFKL